MKKTHVLVLVLMFGGALWVRCHHRKSQDSQPPPPVVAPTPPPETTDETKPRSDAAIAVAVVVDAARPAPSPRWGTDDLHLWRLSSDGKRALLMTLPSRPDGPKLRSIVIDTGAIDTDIELRAFIVPSADDQVPDDPKARANDLMRARSVLREFPLGSGGEFASSADGSRGAYSMGDDLHTVTNDKLGPKVALAAAYDPLILPGGKTLLMRGYDGEIDGPGTGKYSLFEMPLDVGGKPKKIATTDGSEGPWALSAAGDTLRMVVKQPPTIPPCVQEISLTKLKVVRQRCLEKADHVVLSTTGEWVAWTTLLDTEADATFGRPRKVTSRLRVMNLATGTVGFDGMGSGELAISDKGRLVVQDQEATYDIEAGHAREIDLPAAPEECLFRGATELVCEHDGSVTVIDLTALATL